MADGALLGTAQSRHAATVFRHEEHRVIAEATPTGGLIEDAPLADTVGGCRVSVRGGDDEATPKAGATSRRRHSGQLVEQVAVTTGSIEVRTAVASRQHPRPADDGVYLKPGVVTDADQSRCHRVGPSLEQGIVVESVARLLDEQILEPDVGRRADHDVGEEGAEFGELAGVSRGDQQPFRVFALWARSGHCERRQGRGHSSNRPRYCCPWASDPAASSSCSLWAQ